MRASEVTAGELLRQARRAAGLSQRELAGRAGMSQSVIATYERDNRAPALSTLAALIEATGVTLEVDLGAPCSAPPVGGPIGRRLRRRRAEVLAIARRFGITNVRVFGSVARAEETTTSDLDLLVDVPDGIGLLGLARFRAELERLLGVTVDVVPDDSLKPRLRARVEADLVPL